MSTPAARRSASTARISASVSPRPTMRPLLVTWPGRRARGRPEHVEAARVVALGRSDGNSRGTISTLWLNTSGARGQHRRPADARSPLKSGVSTSTCAAGRRSRTARTVAAKCAAPPSAQVVARHRGQHDVAQAQARRGLGHAGGLVRVRAAAAAPVLDRAVPAAPRAAVAEQHERGGARARSSRPGSGSAPPRTP